MSVTFNPLNYPVIFTPSLRPGGDSAWREHLPFAKFLVEIVQPKTLVELGTYAGASYCAFCQAVQYLGLDTLCYAVDTWQGDAHIGYYGTHDSAILNDLREHHDPLYSDFSTLIQGTFDDALPNFADATIDLLHIDGFHTYEAVKNDYETWSPKVSARGVVLFHDIAVTSEGFDVNKFWQELTPQYSDRHFEFHHGNGLGVLAVGPEQSQAVLDIVQLSTEEAEMIRLFFSSYGGRIGDLHLAELQLHDSRQYVDNLLNSRSLRVGRALERVYRIVRPR